MTQSLTLTVDEVAKLLGISRGLCYEGVRSGSIPSVRVGHRILIPRALLMELLLGERGAKDSDVGDAA